MEREVLAGLVAEGLTLEQLGDRLGLHPSTVSYWLKKLDLRPERRAVYAPKGGLHRAQLESLLDQGLTTAELASALDRSQSTIRYWLEKHGLKTQRARRELTLLASGEAVGDCRRHGRVRFVQRRSDGCYRCAQCRSADVARRRRRVKALLVEEAGGACSLCGYDRFVGALQFHHVDPATKDFSLSHAGVTRSIELARREAAKCVLLCANCHAEVEGGIVAVDRSDGAGVLALPHLDGPG